MDDPAFALRREEFEQWLVRRKEALEHQFAERKAELEKGFEDRAKARVEAQMKKGPSTADWEEDTRTARLKKTISELRSRLAHEVKLFDEQLTEKIGAMPRALFNTLVKILHPDNPPPTVEQRMEAFGLLTQWHQKENKRAE
jgi:flagellar biosynthesis/type III secretory pathway protein FliH